MLVLTGVRRVTQCPHNVGVGFMEDALLDFAALYLNPTSPEPEKPGSLAPDIENLVLGKDGSLFFYCGEQCPDSTTNSVYHYLYMFGYDPSKPDDPVLMPLEG